MHKLHLPRLGQTMEQGLIERWLKQEGDSFEIGELLYEVETEKATIEIEAKLPGTLARIVTPEGSEVPVSTLLAIVADPGETLSEDEIAAALEELTEASGELETVLAGAPTASPPRETGGSPPVGTPTRAVPRARALARERGIDLAGIAGTGPRGAITVEDVGRASGDGGLARIRERRPVRGVARAMAEVVARSWAEVPQFVQQVLVDASALKARREREAEAVRESSGFELSYNDLLLAAAVAACRDAPEANASFQGDTIALFEDVNLSIAVASDAGLIVPVIHRAQELSLGELGSRARELAEKARAGSLAPDEVRGGTITVSNLGMYGIDTGFPLVTTPQAAVVFAGTIAPRPVAVGDSVEVRPTVWISAGYDHRVLDGATAARFTAALKRCLEAE